MRPQYKECVSEGTPWSDDHLSLGGNDDVDGEGGNGPGGWGQECRIPCAMLMLVVCWDAPVERHNLANGS
jgi:hypothetical protein